MRSRRAASREHQAVLLGEREEEGLLVTDKNSHTQAGLTRVGGRCGAPHSPNHLVLACQNEARGRGP